ncbi:MAG: hypothetical protein LBH25_09525 [Fibromonadaceae bacterium]|nr:hypothetical protein [Fibromonadaceae bacterium]
MFADRSFIRVCMCGRGSGKTRYLGFEAFAAAMQGQQIIIASPTLHRSQGVLKEARSIAQSIPISFGAKATDKRCVNLKAQCYIGLLDRMREGITYGAQCKHLKDELVRDLMAARPTPDESNQGRFGIIPKDQVKKEIKRSPDIGDAVALAFVNYNPPDLKKAMENLRGLMA